MPEAVYFRGRVIVGKRIGEKTYVRIDVYPHPWGIIGQCPRGWV